MKKEDSKAQAKIVELEGQLSRLGADFANFRRRTEENQSQLTMMAQAKVLLELTPVMDNFRRASEHLPAELKDNNWVSGVLYVEKQLAQIMEAFGLEKIKTVGEKFNPLWHEAIEMVENEASADTVIDEVEAGYMLASKVLKPAKVKVSKGLLTKM